MSNSSFPVFHCRAKALNSNYPFFGQGKIGKKGNLKKRNSFFPFEAKKKFGLFFLWLFSLAAVKKGGSHTLMATC